MWLFICLQRFFDHNDSKSLLKANMAGLVIATNRPESDHGAQNWPPPAFQRTLPVMNRKIYRKSLGVLTAPLILVLLTGCFGTGQTGAHDSMPAMIAKQAIERDTQIPASKIVITDIDAVDYRDSSLGCPQPDMTYLQVITPGYRVKARAKGRKFDVRIAGERAIVCDPNRSNTREIRVVPPAPENVRTTTDANSATGATQSADCDSSGPWGSNDCDAKSASEEPVTK